MSNSSTEGEGKIEYEKVKLLFDYTKFHIGPTPPWARFWLAS